jgi:hypothetical protein
LKEAFNFDLIWLKTILRFCKMSSTIQYSQPAPAPSIPVGDPISQLPVDQTPPNPTEIQIIDTLFKKHRRTMDIVFDEAKDSLLVALLVILVCLPQVDVTIRKFLPITDRSPYILVLVKGLVAAVLFWLTKYFYLSRKSS